MDAVLKGLKEIKDVLVELTGSSDLPKKDQFSKAALADAAKAFRKLSIERGEWIADDKVDRVIKNAPYRVAAFIIKEFGFRNPDLNGLLGNVDSLLCETDKGSA